MATLAPRGGCRACFQTASSPLVGILPRLPSGFAALVSVQQIVPHVFRERHQARQSHPGSKDP